MELAEDRGCVWINKFPDDRRDPGGEFSLFSRKQRNSHRDRSRVYGSSIRPIGFLRWPTEKFRKSHALRASRAVRALFRNASGGGLEERLSLRFVVRANICAKYPAFQWEKRYSAQGDTVSRLIGGSNSGLFARRDARRMAEIRTMEVLLYYTGKQWSLDTRRVARSPGQNDGARDDLFLLPQRRIPNVFLRSLTQQCCFER